MRKTTRNNGKDPERLLVTGKSYRSIPLGVLGEMDFVHPQVSLSFEAIPQAKRFKLFLGEVWSLAAIQEGRGRHSRSPATLSKFRFRQLFFHFFVVFPPFSLFADGST